MLLLTYFIIIFFLCNFRKSASPGLLLISLYIVSLTCGLLIGYDNAVNSLFRGFNLLFLVGMLSILILPWNKFKFKMTISDPNLKRLHQLTICLLYINAVIFVVLLVVSFYLYASVSSLAISAFRNEEDVPKMVYASIPVNHTLQALTHYLYPTSFFLIPLHFFYLVKRKYLLSILCLVFSFNVILDGIIAFSRSNIARYFFLYILYLSFFYSKMDNHMRNVTKATGLVFLGCVSGILIFITITRFGDYFQYGDAIYAESFIQNPVLYSVLDYIGQWYENCGHVMARYSFVTLNGELSFPLLLIIADKLQIIDYADNTLMFTLESIWGEYYDKFHGLIANLLFDFGYAGTTLFVLLYALVLHGIRPIKGIISFPHLLILGPLFFLPAMGIFGYEMKSTSYNLLIVYSLMIYVYLKAKWTAPRGFTDRLG